MNSIGVRITGTGSFLPPRVVTNDQLAYLAVKPSWVDKHFGIQTRHMSWDPEARKMDSQFHDGDLAFEAAKRALEMAKVMSKDLDLIVRITCTPEYLHFPDSACMLHGRLDASRDCAAFSLDSGCGGLVYALNIVTGMIRGGDGIRRALVVPSNTSSPFHTRWDPEEPRRQALEGVLFGDGASALVLERTDDPTRGILSAHMGAWPVCDPISYPAGGSRNPTIADNWREHEYRLDPKAVKRESPFHFKLTLESILAKAKLAIPDINWFLFHQVNFRILQKMSAEFGIPWSKMLVNADRYGNTSAASIGILMDEAVREGKFRAGDRILMVAVGAGWQYGSVLVRW